MPVSRIEFLAKFPAELNHVWCHVVANLSEIRVRSGNAAAAELCEFSQNWRTHRSGITETYRLGVQQRVKQFQEEQKEHQKKGESGNHDNDNDVTDQSRDQDQESREKDRESGQVEEPRDQSREKGARDKSESGTDRHVEFKGSEEVKGSREVKKQVKVTRQGEVIPYSRSHKTGMFGVAPLRRPRPKSSKNRHNARRAQEQDGGQQPDVEAVKQDPSREEASRLEKQVRDLESQLQAADESRLQLERQLDDVTGAHEQLELEYRQLEADKARLLDRVVELNEVKVAHDEQELQLRYVAERNSPLKVVQEFELLVNNEWADAKQALDEYSDWKVQDRDKYEILTSALMECFVLAEQTYSNYRAALLKLLRDPFAAARHPGRLRKKTDGHECDMGNGNVEDTENTHGGNLGDDLEAALTRYMKVQCDALDTRHTSRYVLASCFATLHPLLIASDIAKSARIKYFVRASLTLCWKMALQSPPLTFDLPGGGGQYCAARHELHHASEPASRAGVVLDYVVYPGIKQGSVVMQKALVILAPPREGVEEAQEEL